MDSLPPATSPIPIRLSGLPDWSQLAFTRQNQVARDGHAQTAPKTLTNLTLDSSLLTEARSFGVNLSQAAGAGLRRAVAEAKAWQRKNAIGLASSNAWDDKHGLPLDQYRQF